MEKNILKPITQASFFLPNLKSKLMQATSSKSKETTTTHNGSSTNCTSSLNISSFKAKKKILLLNKDCSSQICDVYYFHTSKNVFLFIRNSKYTPKSNQKGFEIKEKVEIPFKYKMRILNYSSMPECIRGPSQLANLAFKVKLSNSNMIWHLYPYEKMKQIVSSIQPNQRYNHFPFTFQLGRKDNMYRHHRHFKVHFPKDFKFAPCTYILPTDEVDFRKKIANGKKRLWIVKPVNSSRGRGVHLLRNNEFERLLKVSASNNNCQYLISKYIASPHLINSKKYDLRIYVLITSFSPLKIYLYKEGLVRFATEKYEKSNTQNIFIHLTNYSINKHNKNYIFNQNEGKEEDETSSKWSLEEYRSYFLHTQQEDKFNTIWKKIKDIVVKTVITVSSEAIGKIPFNKTNSFFELYGFDILIDKKYKPWLLEVNVNASLNCTSPLDLKIKSDLISDTFNIVGIVPYHHNYPSLIFNDFFDEDSKQIKAKQDLSVRMPHSNDNMKSIFTNKSNVLRDFDKNNLKLSNEEYNTDYFKKLIEETQEEFARSSLTDSELVFPLKSNVEYYSQFLMFERNPNTENIVIWQWLLTH